MAVVGAAVAGYLALTAGPATAKQFATLTVLEGTVEVRETGTSAFQSGTTGDTLRQGDAVRTGDDGRADIEYFDGSVTRLDAGTELVLKELASVPDVPNSKTIVADQTSGKTLNRVVELTDSESRFETETPSAVASVRGTIYVVFVYPNGSSEYWVFDGTLLIELPDGTIVEVNAGEGVFVDAHGEADEVFELTDQDQEELCDLDPEFCPDEVEGTEIEEPEADEEDEVQGTTITQEETDDDVTLIPPIVIIRPGPDDGDTDPPNTTIESGPDDESEVRHAEFVVSADEPNSTFECSLGDGDVDPAFGPCPTPPEAASRRTQAAGTTTLTILYTDLIDDLYSFQVRATDAAGNIENTPASRSWTVSAPPDTFINPDVGPPHNATVSATSATFEVSSDEDDVTFQCLLDGEDIGCDAEPAVEEILASAGGREITVEIEGLADDKPHTFQAIATDSTSKTDTTPATRNWFVGDPDVLTAVLTWVHGPVDLDIHAVWRDSEGEEVGHVYFGNLCHPDPACWAQLDLDNVSISPPGTAEAITIRRPDGFSATSFEIYVVNFRCDQTFQESSARVDIFGLGTSSTFMVSSAGDQEEKRWNVATLEVPTAGNATVISNQTMGESSPCGEHPPPPEPQATATQVWIAESFSEDSEPEARLTLELATSPTPEGDIKVEWAPEELEGEVRVSSEEFPDDISDGELGCRGVGQCVIEDVEPGATLYLTVFPAGVTSLEPVEDVTSIRIEVPPAPEPSPEPSPEPTPEPEPAVENEPPPEPEPTPSPSPSPPPQE